MAIPVVVTFGLPTAAATAIANNQPATSLAINLNGTIGTGVLCTSSATANLGQALQQRVVVTSAGNDSAINFKIVGLNMAGFTVGELLTGSNGSFVVSQQDYTRVLSVRPQTLTGGLGTTAGTCGIGTFTTGACLWNFTNWDVTPSSIQVSCVPVSSNTCNYTVQYTYDDPNSLPTGNQSASPFNISSMSNTSVAMDATISDPVTAVRLLVNSGTGSVRFTMIQAGIAGP